jgi:hypothetical protein
MVNRFLGRGLHPLQAGHEWHDANPGFHEGDEIEEISGEKVWLIIGFQRKVSG